MSAFWGVYVRHASPTLLDPWAQRLRAAAAEGAKEHLTELRTPHAIILKHDWGAFASRGELALQSGAIAVVAGHPHVDSMACRSRSEQLGAIASELARDNAGYLAATRGSYTLAYVDALAPRLILATDSLGIRPVYYLDDGEKVVFSSTMSAFERLSELQLRADERGMTEKAALGFSLADRTRYDSVKCLPHGQARTFSSGPVVSHEYWNWSASVVGGRSQAEISRHVFDSFVDAIRIRLTDEKRVMAFLSGGLDSRCVVGAVRGLGVEVNTVNFAPENSQDLIFGAQIAAVASGSFR